MNCSSTLSKLFSDKFGFRQLSVSSYKVIHTWVHWKGPKSLCASKTLSCDTVKINHVTSHEVSLFYFLKVKNSEIHEQYTTR